MSKSQNKFSARPQPRKFNIAGSIIPEKHYYVDLTPQIKKLFALVEEETYFVINRPRQFGKTTVLNFLAQSLRASGKYASVLISFQGFTQSLNITEAEFYAEAAKFIQKDLALTPARAVETNRAVPAIGSRFDFFDWLEKACQGRKLVLLIDEIDAAPENVIIGFLAGLREMYLQRGRKPAPHCVCLAGVHDIKNLQARYREEKHSRGSASPFNIAIDYELPPFSLANIRQYYLEHTAATGQVFDEKVFARMHEVTSGHPWLVSSLAKLLVEKIAPKPRQKIRLEHVQKAIQELIASRNANFDSLFKNAHHPRLFPLVLDLLEGEKYRYNIQDDDIDLGVKYGIFAESERRLGVANLIYAQVLFQHFERELKGLGIKEIVAANHFEDRHGRLNFRLILEKFQAFMKAKGREVVEHPTFREATGQLLLLSYIDQLVNGKGWTFKEVRTGKGRIDVLCCYGRQKEVVELKLWYGANRYSQGLQQLVKYLESESLDHGYLVVLDRRENSPRDYATSEHRVAGKHIQAWVI